MDTLHSLYRAHPKSCLFTTAALLRVFLALIFSALPDLLTLRVEISTPVSSFKRCTSITREDEEQWRCGRWAEWQTGQDLS